MITPQHLIYCRPSSKEKTWKIFSGQQMVGLISPNRPQKNMSVMPLRRFGSGKFLSFLMEKKEEEADGLVLVALIQLPNGRKIAVDSTGKNTGDWQGEWVRILGHPAGRIIYEKSGQWNWIGPSGRILSQWTRTSENRVDLFFSGLATDQGYCRLVAATWTWEVIQQVV